MSEAQMACRLGQDILRYIDAKLDGLNRSISELRAISSEFLDLREAVVGLLPEEDSDRVDVE